MVRQCGTCTACCVAPAIDEEFLLKPAWTHCPNLTTTKTTAGNCRVYNDETRPETCYGFNCVWLENTLLTKHFRPDRYGIMLAGRPGKKLEVWELFRKWEGSELQAIISWQCSDWEVRVISRPKPAP